MFENDNPNDREQLIEKLQAKELQSNQELNQLKAEVAEIKKMLLPARVGE